MALTEICLTEGDSLICQEQNRVDVPIKDIVAGKEQDSLEIPVAVAELGFGFIG